MLPLALILAASFAQQTQQSTWVVGGTGAAQYVTKAVGNPQSAAGAAIEVGSTTAPANVFAAVSTTLPATNFHTRRVRVVADVETRDVTGRAAPWVRADGPGGMLMIDNGQDRALKGTANGQIEVTIVVPPEATSIVVGVLMSGSGEAKISGLRVIAGPLLSASAGMDSTARLVLDSAIALVRRHALWRDTVTWSAVEPPVRLLASGAARSEDAYPAIKYLLNRLGDHHSFHMNTRSTQSFTTGGAQNPRPEVRSLEPAIGYISVPAYSGGEQTASQAYARDVHAALEKVAPLVTCGWLVDLRGNGGGNMWPMLNGLQPFLGSEGLGSFVSAEGSGPLWRAGDNVGVAPPASLNNLKADAVAVLTGPRTASSGEAVAISFRGRPNTRSFGQPTAGLSTANENYRLPDGSMILLTVSVEADRTGKRYGDKILPDELIEAAQGTPDPQIAGAIRWLRAQPTCK
jgi:carboxyl-terminal processing protease